MIHCTELIVLWVLYGLKHSKTNIISKDNQPISYQKTINQYYIKRLSTNMKKAISTLVSGITSKKGQIKMFNKLFANVNYVLFYKVTVICRSGSGCIEGWKGKGSLCYWIKNCKELFGIQSVMCQIKGGSKRTRSVTS